MGSTLEDSLMFCVDAVGSAHTAPAAHQSLTVILRGRIVLFELLGELSHLFFFFWKHHFYLKMTDFFLKMNAESLSVWEKVTDKYLLPEFSSENFNFGRLVSATVSLVKSQYLMYFLINSLVILVSVIFF